MFFLPYLSTSRRLSREAAASIVQATEHGNCSRALKRQVRGALAGIDGFTLTIYQKFSDFLTPRMFDVFTPVQRNGPFPLAWFNGFNRRIPKIAGATSVYELCPILKHLKKKWFIQPSSSRLGISSVRLTPHNRQDSCSTGRCNSIWGR